MSEAINGAISGGCHCGTVRYEATGEPGFAAHCQCTDCRKFSGSAHKSFMMMSTEDLTVTGQVTGYDYEGGSGGVITHHFCAKCGAGIFSKHSDMDHAVFLYASALDDPENFKPTMVSYTRSAPSWDHINPELTNFARGFRDS